MAPRLLVCLLSSSALCFGAPQSFYIYPSYSTFPSYATNYAASPFVSYANTVAAPAAPSVIARAPAVATSAQSTVSGYPSVKGPNQLFNRAFLPSDRFVTKPDLNHDGKISQFPAPEPLHVSSGQVNSVVETSIRKVTAPHIVSLQPATDHKDFPIDANFYATKVYQFPTAITSAISAVMDERSPNAAATLAYMLTINSQDICARSTQLYMEVILQGGTVDEATVAATKRYIEDYNNGLSVAPGSSCEASDIAYRKAAAEGKDPVLYSAIAFMENWPGMKEGNPCAIAGRDYVNAVLEGASHTQANLIGAKSFGEAIKVIAAKGGELRDPACAAATKAYFNALPTKPSPPNAAAMITFIDKAFEGFSFKYDPACYRATEEFYDAYAEGDDELKSTRRAAKVFLQEFMKGGDGIPADSPCAASTRAYYNNIPNPPSPANKAAMEAFMDKMNVDGPREYDPACAVATLKYWDAYEAGATETDANLAAAEGFFQAYKEGLHIAADSPCVAATKAYFNNIPNKPSPPNAIAMIAFMDAMIAQGNKRVYDPVCYKATEAFYESFRAGDDELTANFKANLAFIKEYKKGAKVPTESPCKIATVAYSQAIRNRPSPPNRAAMMYFMEEAVLSKMDKPDPVCLAAAEAYYDAYLAGEDELKANEIAAVAFLDAVAASPDYDPGSPCGISAKAYMAHVDGEVKEIYDSRGY